VLVCRAFSRSFTARSSRKGTAGGGAKAKLFELAVELSQKNGEPAPGKSMGLP